MGRWTGQTYQLKHYKILTVITAYSSCKQNSTIIKLMSSTTNCQQTIMLTEEGFTNPDPRKIFIDDIINVINEQNNTISNCTILMFDANEHVNDSEGGLAILLQETPLVDAYSII
jgi:hypothetical protein